MWTRPQEASKSSLTLNVLFHIRRDPANFVKNTWQAAMRTAHNKHMRTSLLYVQASRSAYVPILHIGRTPRLREENDQQNKSRFLHSLSPVLGFAQYVTYTPARLHIGFNSTQFCSRCGILRPDKWKRKLLKKITHVIILPLFVFPSYFLEDSSPWGAAAYTRNYLELGRPQRYF